MFEGQDIIYFSAGAGGKGGEEGTKKVDFEGAVKVFDAIEGVRGQKPRLILVSAVDIRDPDKVPAHYVSGSCVIPSWACVCVCDESDRAIAQTEADIAMSKRVRGAIPAYMHWKYEADKDLVKRDAFKWTILRAGGLTNNPGTGKASIGRTHLVTTVSVSPIHIACE